MTQHSNVATRSRIADASGKVRVWAYSHPDHLLKVEVPALGAEVEVSVRMCPYNALYVRTHSNARLSPVCCVPLMPPSRLGLLCNNEMAAPTPPTLAQCTCLFLPYWVAGHRVGLRIQTYLGCGWRSDQGQG